MAKYFLHNGVEGETEFYDSWEELQEAYEDLRSQYLDMDDGWDEEITAICAGEVTHRATMTDIQYPPKRENFKSEEAYQIAVEEYGIDVDYYAYKCDYKLLPLAISSMPTGKSLIDSKNQEEIENIKGNSRMKILNLTQHKATPEQIEQGVIELDEDTKEWVKEHGSETVYDVIHEAGSVDLEEHAEIANKALDEAFGSK